MEAQGDSEGQAENQVMEVKTEDWEDREGAPEVEDWDLVAGV